MRALIVTMSLMGLLAAASPVQAAHPVDAAAAQKLFERGRTAARRGDWQRACDDFAASQKLDPGAGTLLNLATNASTRVRCSSVHFDRSAFISTSAAG